MGRKVHPVPHGTVSPPPPVTFTGQLTATLGGMTSSNVAATAGWNGTSTVDLGVLSPGQVIDISAHYTQPAGSDFAFTKQSQIGAGTVGVNAATGAITVPPVFDTYTLAIDLSENSAALATLTLTGGSAGKAWTFGHAFAKGDVASNRYITATGATSFQAEVRNRWSDGSVKFAVLSGIGGTSIALQSTSTAAATGEVALVDPQASVTFTGGVTGSYACPTTNTVGTWAKATASLVRKISNPVMTERHYYVPTTDAHVAVWFYVRSYVGGATEVETVVENGWWNVASPTVKTYGVTVNVGASGNPRYTGSLTHYHHTRWSRVDWVGTNPAITPVHDGAYLRSTKLVPNLVFSGATNAALTFAVTTENQTPFAFGDFPTTDLSVGGENPQIGPVAYWDSHWVASQDSRATVATLGNARNQGRYSIYYRDETTGRPVKPRSYPLYYYADAQWGYGTPSVSGGTALPTPSGGSNTGVYDTAHQFPPALCAYLISGRWSFLESTQMQASADAFDSGSNSVPARGANFLVSVASGQTRATAWNTRARMLAALISPTTIEPLIQAEYAAITQASIQGAYTYWTVTQGNPPTGIVAALTSYLDTDYTAGYYSDSPWQQHYNDIVYGWTVLCEPENVDLTSATNLALYAAKHPVGLTGTNATWNYRDVPYTVPYGLGAAYATTVWQTWAQAYQAWLNDHDVTDTPYAAISDADGLSITYGRVDQVGWSYNFPTITLAAIVTATNIGASGASAGYQRYLASSTYQAAASLQKLKDDPRWAFGVYS